MSGNQQARNPHVTISYLVNHPISLAMLSWLKKHGRGFLCPQGRENYIWLLHLSSLLWWYSVETRCLQRDFGRHGFESEAWYFSWLCRLKAREVWHRNLEFSWSSCRFLSGTGLGTAAFSAPQRSLLATQPPPACSGTHDKATETSVPL